MKSLNSTNSNKSFTDFIDQSIPFGCQTSKNLRYISVIDFKKYKNEHKHKFKAQKIPHSQYIPFFVLKSSKKLTKLKVFNLETEKRSKSRTTNQLHCKNNSLSMKNIKKK